MKKIFFLILIISLTTISCKKDFPIPKQPAEISPELILTAALSGTASNVATNYIGLTRWMGYWARSGEFISDLQTETYDIKNDYTDNEWANIYLNLNIYNELEKLGRNNTNPFNIGAAKAMKVYDFSMLVDLYNDVPYKEAFNPATKNQPVYDTAQDIYNDLVFQLDSAFSYFEKARDFYKSQPADVSVTDDSRDIMFGSARINAPNYNARITLWEKFVNTLELKLLMHQSQVGTQQNFIQQHIKNITTSAGRKTSGFLNAGESAAINSGYSSNGTNPNPFYKLFYSATGDTTRNYNYYRENAYAGNFYINANDARNSFSYSRNIEKAITGGYKFWIVENAGVPIVCSENDKYVDDTCLTFYDSTRLIFYENSTVGNSFSDTLDANILGVIYDGDDNWTYIDSNQQYHETALLFDGIFLLDGACSGRGLSGCFFSGRGSFIGTGLLKGFDQDQLILSDFESLFLQAEAAQRGYINGNAQTLYESAITQNFVYLYKGNPGDPIADARKYFSQSLPDVGWTASANKLEAIMTQKWAAMNGVNWVEAYNDYRRTGYPTSNVLGISHAPTHIRPQIPTRFLYPQSQLNTNSAHVPPLPDAQYSKVFWNQ